MERNFFLDNLRSLMIIMIVIFHCALAYTTEIIPWWYAIDRNDHPVFDVFILILDYFQIPVLFLLAGYFSVPSLQRHGILKFIGNKIRKLAIPLVMLSIVYVPIMPYIRYRMYAENPVGYLTYLHGYLSTITDVGIIILKKSTALKYINSFSVCHLWFISVLFIFFCFIGIGYNFFLKEQQSTSKMTKPYTTAFCLTGGVTAFSMAIINLSFFDWEWVIAGTFFLFGPTRIPLSIGMFFLGVYGYKNNWFIKDIPGKPWKWYFISIVLSLGLMANSKYIWDYQDNSIGISLIHGFFRSFCAIAWFCFFLNFSKKYLNKTNRALNFLNKHSYETYLLHLPIVVLLQYLFLNIRINIGLKFILISFFSILLTLAFSSLIYKRIQLFIETFLISKPLKDFCESE